MLLIWKGVAFVGRKILIQLRLIVNSYGEMTEICFRLNPLSFNVKYSQAAKTGSRADMSGVKPDNAS